MRFIASLLGVDLMVRLKVPFRRAKIVKISFLQTSVFLLFFSSCAKIFLLLISGVATDLGVSQDLPVVIRGSGAIDEFTYRTLLFLAGQIRL
jgi:hypothetical protein